MARGFRAPEGPEFHNSIHSLISVCNQSLRDLTLSSDFLGQICGGAHLGKRHIIFFKESDV